MLNKFMIALCLLWFVAGPCPQPAHAEDGDKSPLSLGVQTGYLGGNTTYHISEYSGTSGVESELRFPLQTVLAGVRAGYCTAFNEGRNELQLTLSWMTNLTSGAGKVQDSDWLSNDLDIVTVGAAHAGTDIYSESDMRLHADVYDLRAAFGFLLNERFTIGPMAGYKHQSFRYDISNVDQVGYGPYATPYTAVVAGPVGTYKAEYDMVYAGIAASMKGTLGSGELVTSAQIGIIPFVSVQDRDDHMLRSKMSTCHATGAGALASLGSTWKFSPRWSLGLNGEFLRTSARGIQHQYFYGGASAGTAYEINDTITSTQLTLVANVSAQF